MCLSWVHSLYQNNWKNGDICITWTVAQIDHHARAGRSSISCIFRWLLWGSSSQGSKSSAARTNTWMPSSWWISFFLLWFSSINGTYELRMYESRQIILFACQKIHCFLVEATGITFDFAIAVLRCLESLWFD